MSMSESAVLPRPAAAKPARPKAQAATEAAATRKGERVRISLDVSPDQSRRLDALASDIDGTKSDVLRKALALFELAVEAKKAGKRIGFADRSEQLTTEIVGIGF